jgi:uncharacterized membrane protein YqhA
VGKAPHLVEADIILIVLGLIDVVMISNHLLKTFINAENLSDKVLIAQTVIHMAFVLSAIAIAYVDKLMRVENKH